MAEVINKNPLVTVYIPTYNRVELLKRAVESVRQQTYENLEIIIVDDCSTDATHDYLKEVEEQDTRIRYFLKEKNSGACVSRNIAIENATGEFITGLDDDDYFLKNRIQIFLSYKNKLNDFEFLFSNSLIKNKKSIKQSITNFIKPKRINFKYLLCENYIGNQIFTTVERLKKNKFDKNLTSWQDLDAWLSLLNGKNKAALLVGNLTYVTDISHDFGRISLSKKEKLLVSYNYIVEKYNLNFFQKNILFNQLSGYGFKLNINKIILRIFYVPRFFILLSTILMIFQNIRMIFK